MSPHRIFSHRFLATLGLLLVTALAGCDRAEATGAPAEGGQVRLELWTWALRPWFDEYMTDLVADFEDRHPEVDVVWVDVPADAMRRKMFAAGAAGQLPDVINFSDKDFALFASLGALRPIGPIAPGDPFERYVGGALAAGEIDGQILGLPWYLSTPIRVMNTQLLAEGGLSVETLSPTWEGLIPQARAFYEATGKYLLSLPLGKNSDLPLMLYAEGLDPLVKEEGRWKSRLTEPAIVEYVRRWVELYRDGALPREAATEDWSQMVRNYTEGRVAMINGDAVRSVKSQAPAIYGVTQVGPGVKGALGADSIAVTFVSVGGQSEHPKWAAKLAWHVTSPPWQERLAKQASRIPGTAESLDRVEAFLPETPEGEEPDPKREQALRQGVEQMEKARAWGPPIGPWPDLRRAFDDRIQRALLGGAPVEQVLAEIDREWQRILDADAAGMPYR